MELMDLYKQLENPIEKDETIAKLVDIYANGGDYYDGLTNSSNKVNSGRINRSDADKFYALLFNKWKKKILEKSSDELRNMNYKDDYIKLHDYLIHIPDVTTEKEANEILLGKKNDKELEQAFKNYSWTALSGDRPSSWIHIYSYYFNKEYESLDQIEHRLYINAVSDDLFKIIPLLIEKFEKYKLPYYFKFSPDCHRDDSIVIYSKTHNLGKYVDILKEIKREYPNLISRMQQPPLVTGRLDGWIGYGSEPELLPNGKQRSFNELRAKIIKPAIESVTKKWLMDNKNKTINYYNQRITVAEYYAIKCVDSFISKLEYNYFFIKNGKTDEETIKVTGYSLETIRSKSFRNEVYNAFHKHLDDIITVICTQKQGSIPFDKILESLIFYGNNGKRLRLDTDFMYKGIRLIAPEILKHNSNYSTSIKAAVKENSKNAGIDADKFCVDIAAKRKMENFSNSQKNANAKTQSNGIYRRELDKSILNNIKQKIIKYLKTNGLSSVDEVMKKMDLVSGLYVENLKEHSGALMQSRGNPNEIAIDIQFVQFDKNHNPIGFHPNLSKLIESQLGHELLHTGSRDYIHHGIMSSKAETGLNEGFTQLITENIFGYTVSSNTDGYRMLKKFAKILEATFGKSCILEAYFNNSMELKNKLNGIKPNYYTTFNQYLTMANNCRKEYNLEKFYDLLMRDVVINIVLPTIKSKSPEEASKYIKNIALYFKDEYKISMDFLGIIEEYKNMDEQTLINKKSYVERDLGKEYIRMKFSAECQKDDTDISKLVTIDNHGYVMSHFDGKSFSVTNENTLQLVYAKYYEQVIINDSNRLANIDKKIEAKLANNDFHIKFSSSMKGNIAYKRAALAYFKKIAKNKGIIVNNPINDLGDVDEIVLDVINLNDPNRFDLDGLRSMLDKYDFVHTDPNNPQKYDVIDKKTKETVKNEMIRRMAAFAHLWLSAFGNKRMTGEKYHGETHAFSKYSHKIYKEMCDLIQKSMKEYGTINVDELSKELENGDVNVPLSKMFKNPQSTEIVYKYFDVLIPKEEKILETDATKIYNSKTVDYQGVIEARINEIIPSNNKTIYEELNEELARGNLPHAREKNNNEYYREFVAITDAVANAISIDNDVLVGEAMKKLKEIEDKIAKVDIRNLDLAKASKDQIIQQSLYRMRKSLTNRDIDSYNMYRDRYYDTINGKYDVITYH